MGYKTNQMLLDWQLSTIHCSPNDMDESNYTFSYRHVHTTLIELMSKSPLLVFKLYNLFTSNGNLAVLNKLFRYIFLFKLTHIHETIFFLANQFNLPFVGDNWIIKENQKMMRILFSQIMMWLRLKTKIKLSTKTDIFPIIFIWMCSTLSKSDVIVIKIKICKNLSMSSLKFKNLRNLRLPNKYPT